MKIIDLLKNEGIDLNEKVSNKDEVIKKIVNLLGNDGDLTAKEVAIASTASVYENVEEQVDNGVNEKEKLTSQMYKHLMNGISHMLPFVIGGGILIALAFLFDNYSINPSNFGKNTPLAAFFKTVGDNAFGFMLPVLAAYISMSIVEDSSALVVGFVGGVLANAGGSGFLGALIAGFVAGYLMVGIRKLTAKLPSSLEGIRTLLIYPVIGVLLIGIIITFVINPPVSAVNTGLTNGLNSMGGSSKVILGIILGAMMAIDMGGPLNKVAFLFGTASIVNGQYEIMAAVMIGGMTPPLVTALCTTFFRNRFTPKERQTGMTNYIMGLSFITEGAIPFAAADPARVIPSCAIGAAIAGGLSMTFNCAIRAPFGGIFVLPLVTNPLGYFIALATGTTVGMLILGILKKKLKE